jgi:cysteine desulfurase
MNFAAQIYSQQDSILLEKQTANPFSKKQIDAHFASIKKHLNIEAQSICLNYSMQDALESIYFSIFETKMAPTGKTHILVLENSPPFLLKALETLEQLGCVIIKVKCDCRGLVDLADLKDKLSFRAAFLTLFLADIYLGNIQDHQEIFSICHSANVDVHLDLSFVVGTLPLRLDQMPFDFLSFTLMHAKGPIYALSISKEMPLKEKFLFLPHVQLFELSLQKVIAHLNDTSLGLATLKSMLLNQFKQQIEDIVIIPQPIHTLCNHFVISFLGCDQEALLFLLKEKGMDTFIGFEQQDELKNHLLRAKYPSHVARSALCFNLDTQHTKTECEKSVAAIKECVEHLRKVSCHL